MNDGSNGFQYTPIYNTNMLDANRATWEIVRPTHARTHACTHTHTPIHPPTHTPTHPHVHTPAHTHTRSRMHKRTYMQFDK